MSEHGRLKSIKILHKKASVWIERSFNELGKKFTKHTATIDASFFESNVVDHLHTESCT